MKSIFISRILKAESVFYTKLPKTHYRVFAESLIDFKAVDIAEIPESDWLFFYSKNAVRYSVQNERLQLAMQSRKLATMGKGTAQVLQDYGFEADFVGSYDPQETAKRLTIKASKESILFIRANHSRQSIQEHLPSPILTQSLVVYENNPKTDFEIPPVDILVFTSPVNAQTYFGKYDWKPSQKVLAIGYTTAKALYDLGIKEVRVADEPSEEALCSLVLSL